MRTTSGSSLSSDPGLIPKTSRILRLVRQELNSEPGRSNARKPVLQPVLLDDFAVADRFPDAHSPRRSVAALAMSRQLAPTRCSISILVFASEIAAISKLRANHPISPTAPIVTFEIAESDRISRKPPKVMCRIDPRTSR